MARAPPLIPGLLEKIPLEALTAVAFSSQPNGQVHLEWSHAADGQLRLRWTETGGPAVQEPTRRGVGGRIIDGMITQQKGKARFDRRKDGLVCELALRV